MQRERKDKHFLKKPVYPGGQKAMRQFIARHLRYPKEALNARLEGTVVLKYTISHEGKVIGTQVVSSLGGGCDEEACRVAELLEFEVPRQPGKKTKVLFHNTLKVHFRLPKPQAQPAAIEYQYTAAAAPEAPPSSPSQKSYTYTITL